MDPQLAVAALARVIDGGEGPVTVADVDWARFAPVFTLRRPSPLLGGVPEVERALAEAAAAANGAAGDGSGLAGQLAGLTKAEQERVLADVVRTEAAAVLGHASAAAIEADRAFSELGFDSLTAVELRNHLGAVTGLQLPATLLFDYPTLVTLAHYLRSAITHDHVTETLPVLAELDKLEPMLFAIATEDPESARITARLEAVISKWKESRVPMDRIAVAEKIESSTDDEVFDFIGKEFGIS
jgi:acyl carrier protein